MRKGILVVLSLMISMSAFGADKRPMVFRCQADDDKPLEVKLCGLLEEGLKEVDLFYNPDYETENVSLFVDMTPMEHDGDVAVGMAISVIMKKNDTPVPLTMFVGVMITDEERMVAESWAGFWEVINATSISFFDDAQGGINNFCSPKRTKKKGELYAWTETSTCVSMTTARHVSGAFDIPLSR